MVITLLSRPRVAGLVASLVFVCLAEFSVGPSSNRKQLVRSSTGHHREKMCGQSGQRHSVCNTGEILISGVTEIHKGVYLNVKCQIIFPRLKPSIQHFRKGNTFNKNKKHLHSPNLPDVVRVLFRPGLCDLQPSADPEMF